MTPAESMRELVRAVLQISGCGSTLLGVAEAMPDTALEDKDTICSEIFIRSMALEIRRQVDIALSSIEEVESSLNARPSNLASRKDGSP